MKKAMAIRKKLMGMSSIILPHYLALTRYFRFITCDHNTNHKDVKLSQIKKIINNNYKKDSVPTEHKTLIKFDFYTDKIPTESFFGKKLDAKKNCFKTLVKCSRGTLSV